MRLRILKPGASTTVQDLGRYGYGALGIPPSGAMDPWALRAGNLLVGNPEDSAGLEFTFTGPTVRSTADTVVGLTGAEFERSLDGKEIPWGQTMRLKAGEVLEVGKTRGGMRGYLCVRGGIDVPAVMGSRSTFAAGQFGGYAGRTLIMGDMLRIDDAKGELIPTKLAPGSLAAYGSEHVLRVVSGAQEDAFSRKAIATFYGEAFRLSPRSDRMGVRLEGAQLEVPHTSDILPEGVPTGAIQVPGDGYPIILCCDRPTTGGYVKIASVITADLPILAYAKPGDTARFEPVTIEDARAAMYQRERAMQDGFEEAKLT